MIVPFMLFVAGLVAVFAAGTLPELSDYMLVAVPATCAALYLFLRAVFGETAAANDPAGAQKFIVVDGSNVMHWKDETPQLATLKEVLSDLKRRGYSPGVVFDANAGYKIIGRYQHDHALGKLLNLPEDRVMVVPKGTPADPIVLAAARDLGARVVTNDRYRDWSESHPEVREPGHLIRGGYRNGKLWLELDG